MKDLHEIHPGYTQNIDHNFNTFVWSLVVQQPTIRVGTIPDGLTTEVFVAPQPSAIKKAKAQGKGKTEVTEEGRPHLELIADAATRTFDDLQSEFGEALRIAVDPEEIFAAITGSHVKVEPYHNRDACAKFLSASENDAYGLHCLAIHYARKRDRHHRR